VRAGAKMNDGFRDRPRDAEKKSAARHGEMETEWLADGRTVSDGGCVDSRHVVSTTACGNRRRSSVNFGDKTFLPDNIFCSVNGC